MTTRADVVAEAYKWKGVPYRHQGRTREFGVDCIGLPICVSRDLGLIEPDFDVNGYYNVPDGKTFIATCGKYMTLVPQDQLQAGDLIVVAFDLDPQHFGILVPYAHGGFAMLHASNKSNKVDEIRVLYSRAMKYVAGYSLPGVV